MVVCRDSQSFVWQRFQYDIYQDYPFILLKIFGLYNNPNAFGWFIYIINGSINLLQYKRILRKGLKLQTLSCLAIFILIIPLLYFNYSFALYALFITWLLMLCCWETEFPLGSLKFLFFYPSFCPSVSSLQVRHYSMGDYDSKLNEQGRFAHHRANLDGYLRAYLYNPAFYLLSVARAKQMVEAHCGPEEPQDAQRSTASGGQREAMHGARERQANNQKVCQGRRTPYGVHKYHVFLFLGYNFWFIQVQQVIDLVLTCKRNAENEVNREEAVRGAAGTPLGRKRRLEQVKAERAIKYLRASQDCGKTSHVPGEKQNLPHFIRWIHSKSHSLGNAECLESGTGCRF